jgi:hypothetical protein
MTCTAILFDDSKNKVLKTDFITRDNYSLCELEVTKRNEKIQYPKRWKITEINV